MPIVTIALVALNVLIWLLGLFPADRQVEGSTRTISRHDVWQVEYGAIPCEISGNCANQDAVVVVDGGMLDPRPLRLAAEVDQHAPALTLVTSMFLHGGWLHLIFNMLFLWVYGRVVEDAMHPLSFLGFYLAAGMIAGIAQVAVAPSATEPTIGASGAIAAVIGAYVVLYPRARILTMVIPPIFLWLPAWAVAGGWALLQFVGTWRSVFTPAALVGSVAYMSHVVGLLVGIAAVGFLADRRNPDYPAMLAERDGDVRRA